MDATFTFGNAKYEYQDGQSLVHIWQQSTYEFLRGTMYAILGPSGSGKATTLALAGGLDEQTEGRIVYKGRDILDIGLPKYKKTRRALVFQSYNLIPYLSALQNVVTAMEADWFSRKNKKEIALKMLHKVGLSDAEARRNVLRLTGGQQQRVAIARALACDVDLILADEPTGNLDQTTAEDIVAILQELAHEQHKCVIVVTSNHAVAKAADEVIELREGQVIPSFRV